MTRRPVEILELRQKRCSLRFGVGACPAVIGGKVTTQCVGTFATCAAKAAYTPEGLIRWLFTRSGDPVPRLRENVTDNNIITNAYPVLKSTQTSPTKINPGASRKGESPFGVKGTLTAVLDDFRMSDDVADFYGRNIQGPFWPIFQARIGEAASQLQAYLYRGYEGQALGDMQVARYDVTGLDAPVGGAVVNAIDPVERASGRKAQFPRASDLQLSEAIDDTTTAINVVGNEADLTAVFGNTGAQKWLRIGSEIIRYTGYTDETTHYTLTGVTRAQFNTLASSHNQDDLCQRCGVYRRIRLYEVAKDLMENHAQFDADFIDDAQWNMEGGRYLPTLRTRETVISSPEAVESLLGELMRDGMFSAWWDARAQTIPLLAVRPPSATVEVLTDRAHILAPGVAIRRVPDDRLTRVVIYYGQVNPTITLTEPANYRNGRLKIQAGLEVPEYADGSVRELAIFSRWVSSNAQALLVGASLLKRYGVTPEYVSIGLDAKDRGLSVGDVVDVSAAPIMDAYGAAKTKRWQIIADDEPEPGHSFRVELQSFDMEGKFAVIMANDAPDYATATDEEKLVGCWMADETTGLMPDGTDAYLIQ